MPLPSVKAKAAQKRSQTSWSLDESLKDDPATSSSTLAFNRIKLGPEFAQGAEGDLFAAVDRSTGRQLAVKRIRISSDLIKKHVYTELCSVFAAQREYEEEEGEGAGGHPSIVEYIGWCAGPGGIDREIYLVMDRCDFDLADLVRGVREARAAHDRRARESRSKVQGIGWLRFSEREVVKVLWQMLNALAFLNRCGLVHRDVKCENILWQAGKHGLESRYQLSDFGVAAKVGEDVHSAGTLWTMSPELMRRTPGGVSCDVWSLGVVLLEMVFLDRPFDSRELLAFRNDPSRAGFWISMIKPKSPRSPTDVKTSKVAKPRKARSPSPINRGGRRSSAGSRTSMGPSPEPEESRPRMSSDESQPGEFSLKPSITDLERRFRLKWIYSQELWSVLEAMLEEDPYLRPTPEALIKRQEMTHLVSIHGLGGVREGEAKPCCEDRSLTAEAFFHALCVQRDAGLPFVFTLLEGGPAAASVSQEFADFMADLPRPPTRRSSESKTSDAELRSGLQPHDDSKSGEQLVVDLA